MLIGSGEPRLKNYFQIPFATLIKQSSSMYVASLKTKRSCRINLQHLQDLNLIHLRIIGLISIWMKKPHTKNVKNRLGNSIRVGKLMRKWGDYQMGLLLLHFPYWNSFKRYSKPEKSFKVTSLITVIKWEMFLLLYIRKEKSTIKKFQWNFYCQWHSM